METESVVETVVCQATNYNFKRKKYLPTQQNTKKWHKQWCNWRGLYCNYQIIDVFAVRSVFKQCGLNMNKNVLYNMTNKTSKQFKELQKY